MSAESKQNYNASSQQWRLFYVNGAPGMPPLVPSGSVKQNETKIFPDPKPGEYFYGQFGRSKPLKAKPPEAKPPEAKSPEAKSPEAKSPEAKPPEAKPSEAKPSETKPSEAKPWEVQPSEEKKYSAQWRLDQYKQK